MVICKFYLQGTCRFGESCKFEHQISDFNAAVSTSILRQPHPQQQHQQPPPPPQQQNVDANVAIRSVANDMLLAEKGGQWLLSCYAPFRGKPPFPGFDDTSFEEIRYAFSTAQRNGTVEQYKQQLQTLLHEVAMRMRALQNPSPEIVNIIKNLFNAPAANESAKGSFSFAEAGKSVLQQNTTTSPIFQQKPPTSSIFAQANQALFGNQAAQQQQQQNVSVFAQQQQPTSSIFAPQQQQQTVFASSQWAGNAFQQQQQQPSQSTVFQAQQQQPANVFQTSQQQANVFQTPQQHPSVFHQAQQQIQSNQMSIFGGGPALNLSKPQSVDDSAYSRREVLTESEIRAFEADLFEFGQIPEKPPTMELCF